MKKNKLPKEEYFNEDGFFDPGKNSNPLDKAIIILAIIGIVCGIYFLLTL